MRVTNLLSCLVLAACTAQAPMTPRQRADAMQDVPEDHPHPPGIIVSSPADPQGPLRCWDNGEDKVCHRDPN